MDQDLTFVTSFYSIYGEPVDSYLENFLQFAKHGFKTILYLDGSCQSWIPKLAAYPNVRVIASVSFEDLETVKLYPKATTILPKTVNTKKDTYEYLILMNSKLEFIERALPLIKTKHVAWLDFGIAKIFKNADATFNKLRHVNVPTDKVLVAGCYDFTNPQQFMHIDYIHWRFCGGVFFGTPATLLKFKNLADNKLRELSAGKILTWEINIWSLVERNNEPLFEWYKGDHNDTIMNFPLPKKVMVILMIKNESAIIKRCIEKALTIADAILVADTGSTDETVPLLCDLLPNLDIPAKLVGHEWKNFGHNRTLSFQAAVEFCDELCWDKELTYGLLLDADMNFVLTDKFDKTQLVRNGHTIIQKNGSLEYYNTRFVKLGYPWKCTGVTHEYWDGADSEKLTTVYINDIGDGGAKADKFERDMRLLTQGLEEEPNNVRYMFYLAQTYKDLKRLPESIAMYKRRVEAGGWYEEVWYSMYQISRLNYELKNLTEMEYWGMKAYDFHKKRAENLLFLTRIFRERGDNFKAWHYMKLGMSVPKTTDQLFIETAAYDHLFQYEKTILSYYVEPHRRQEATKELMDYYSANGGHCYGNLQHYVDPVKATYKALNYPQIGDFVATSTSILRRPDHYLLNIRYVNYRIQKDGSYMMMDNGNLSRDNPVRTRNFSMRVDKEFNPINEMQEMKPTFPSLHNNHIKGLEDLRIYQDGGELKWVGTTMEYSYDGRIRQVSGLYNEATHTLTNPIPLKPPQNSDCEKNWIPLGNDEYIYGWHPYRIGKIDGDTLQITQTQKTPKYFEHMRGSSNVVEYNGALWAITHVVMYSQPRKYYHHLVRINKETRALEAYTIAFYFKTNHIEYVLGIEIRDGVLYAMVSQNDMDTTLAMVKMEDLKLHSLV
jgi:glycosyltransferase involved in cell wall biosynthesis